MATKKLHSQVDSEDESNCNKKRAFRIVLKDMFKCTVNLERLPDDLVARAKRENGITLRAGDVTSNQQHHNHFRTSSLSQFVVESNGRKTNGVVRAKKHKSIHAPSSDSDSDNSFDVVTADSHRNGSVHACKSNGSYLPFHPSSDSDIDSLDEDNNDDEPLNVNYSIDHKALDSDEQNSVISKSDTKELAQQANGVNSEDSGISEESTEMNGMDAHFTGSFNSPKISDDDGEDDLKFLYGIQEILDRSGDADVRSENRCEDGEVWPTNRIFGEICIKYLLGKCYSTYCDYPHGLPTKVHVASQLKEATPGEIDDAQNGILLRHDKLMTDFFAVFCVFYGRNWQNYRESLRALIPIVSQKLMAPILIKDILNGFIISGMKYSTCINQLLIEIDTSLNAEERFEIMWRVMIDTRNDKIAEHLELFEVILNSDALVAADAINKMIKLQINGDLEGLRMTVVNLVKKSNVTTFLKIDSKLLKTYIHTYVRSFDGCAAKAIKQKATHFGVVFD